MAEGPINYTGLQVQADPVGSYLKGLQGATNIADQQAQIQQRTVQNQQQQFALNQLQNYQTDAQAVMQNPTAQNISQLALKYPQQGEALRANWNLLNGAQQQAELTEGAQVFGALHSGQPDVAANLLEQRIAAQQAAGQPTQNEQMLLNMVKTNPQQAQGYLGITLASIKPDQFGATFNTIQSNQRADQLQPATVQEKQGQADVATANAAQAPAAAAANVAKTQADIANVNDQMQNRAATFGLDVDKFKADTQQKLATLAYNQRVPKLGEGMGAQQAQSVATAAQAQQMSSQAQQLAQQFTQAAPNMSGGIGATIAGGWRNLFGTQNQYDALRKQYAALRTQGITASKFGGSMSDADLKLINSGFPADNAPPEQVASWLGAFSRIQDRTAQQENAKAEWISQAGTVGNAPTDIQVAGVLVPKGMSFNEFISKNPNLGAALQQPNIKVSPQQAGPGAGVLTPQGGAAAAPSVPSYMKYAQ